MLCSAATGGGAKEPGVKSSSSDVLLDHPPPCAFAYCWGPHRIALSRSCTDSHGNPRHRCACQRKARFLHGFRRIGAESPLSKCAGSIVLIHTARAQRGEAPWARHVLALVGGNLKISHRKAPGGLRMAPGGILRQWGAARKRAWAMPLRRPESAASAENWPDSGA